MQSPGAGGGGAEVAMVTSSTQTEVFDGAPRRVGVPAGKKADLVLEGGGVKGIGLVGAVLTLHEPGLRVPACGRDQRGRHHRRARRRVAGRRQAAHAARAVRQLGGLPEVPGRGVGQRALGPVGDAAELLIHMGSTRGTTSSNGSAGSSRRSGSRPSSSCGWTTPGARCPKRSATRSSCTPPTSPAARSCASRGTTATTGSSPAGNASSTRCGRRCRSRSSSNRCGSTLRRPPTTA